MSPSRDGLPIGKPVEYDQSQYLHQVPGGMISNMRHQLKIVGMEDKMEAALEEAAHVRKEFGYPIMVTPLSQYVGTQAAINVMLGERYKEVPDQVIQYALGIWGKEGAELMDPQVKDKILGRPRAKEWTNWSQPDPSLHEVRQKFGADCLRRGADPALLRRRRRRQRLAKRRQAPRISGRNTAAGKADRTAQQAEGLQPDLYQATRLLS